MNKFISQIHPKLRTALMFFGAGGFSVFLMIAGADEPVVGALEGTFVEPWLHQLHIGNSIVFGMGTGIFSGVVVWFVAVYIPEQNKRRILRNNLSNCYRRFRENVLQIFLVAMQQYRDNQKLPQPEYVRAEDLMDYRKCREFFEQNNSEYWYNVANGIDDEVIMQRIMQQMELLSQEAEHVRNHCGIQDQKVHNFLGRMSDIALDFKRTNPHCSYDYTKSLMRFLWEVLAQWSFGTGHQEKDPIQTMIDEI